MIIDLKQKRVDVEKTTEVIDDIKMSFDKDSVMMQFKLFISGIYSNPIGTIVREITSNAIDANVEANNPEAVIIKLNNEGNDEYSISFIDRGVGMSPERVRVYASFLSSTKRTTDTQIGGYGIGGKSILSYKRYVKGSKVEYDNSYYIITRHEGIEYSYMVYEGEYSPMLTSLYTTETTERNGTEIKIPVLESDISRFVGEMEYQLYYFDKVLFVGFDEYLKLNDYTVYEGKSFYYRGNEFSDYIHVTLGKVPYKLDYSALGLNPYEYRIPIAIKLPVNALPVTVSRENLEYSKYSVEQIKEHLKVAIDEIIAMFENQNSNVVTLADYMNISNDKRKILDIGGSYIDISCVLKDKINYKNFKYNHLFSNTYNTPKDLFNLFFTVTRFPKYKNSNFSYYDLSKYSCYYLGLDEKTNRKTSAYIKSVRSVIYLITPKSVYTINGYKYTYDFLNNFKDNEEFTQFYNEIIDIVKSQISDYNSVEIPDTFKDKNGKTYYKKNKEEFSVLFRNNVGESNRHTMSLSKLANIKGTIFYGTKEFEESLKVSPRYFSILFPNVNIRLYNNYGSQKNKSYAAFIQVSKEVEKKIMDLDNCVHISKITEKYFKRKTNFITNYIIGSYANNVFDNFRHDTNIIYYFNKPEFKKINSVVYDYFHKINKYIEKYNPRKLGYGFNLKHLASIMEIDIDKIPDIVELRVNEKICHDYIKSRIGKYSCLDLNRGFNRKQDNLMWELINYIDKSE